MRNDRHTNRFITDYRLFLVFTHHSSLITFHWLLWLSIKKDFYLQHLTR